ncbi:inner membrane protein [Bacteroides faecichinchillae]|uniref:Inner membrane protein n=1 Tax=Bacteroides faecichinchillae TaxID=871325 RepID=A0A1M4S8H8_9BACE|nr:cell envelope integrity protein CreD [Bacteroides faecichinchillae]THG55277.1 cell envelope integrity protein CreD [Bacteroides faecichinchillae]SHE28500.1 inner membrane protein [Bacteroides faecichinchillae]
MDNFNEELNEQTQQPMGCLHRFSKTIKILIIGGLVILLMIPMFMIENLITERGYTQENAINEVSEKWSLAQTISGPYLNIQYPVTTENNEKKEVSIKDLILFPDELLIDGQLKTEILKRSLYEVNVYQSELTLKGSFSSEELIKSRIDMNNLKFDQAAICLNLTDMRGISEQISITLDDSVYIFEPGMDNRGINNTGVHAIADLSALKTDKKLPYEIKIKLKGSQSINFIPLGKTTQVNLKANWNTPSFIGNYLPNNRDITENNFSAQWQVLNLNRNYSQVTINYNQNIKDIENSSFGVNFKIAVEQYQQSMRSAKYAILIILLTFGVIFFTEIMNKTRIHALQYLLVGLALCLFYSLLLSFSEHIGFNPAYLLSSALTVLLVGGYMLGIIRKKKPAFIMVGLLSILYLYIFVLIQLETFALLAGSLGLFTILAIVMYFSKKIDWFNE